MINSSPIEYAFIRACIFVLHGITPVSIAYTVCDALLLLTGQRWRLPTIPSLIRAWFAAETAFYFACQLPLIASIQRDAEHPPLLPESERRALFERVTKDNSPADIERNFRGWFRGAPLAEIGREGVKSWLAWAFFEGRIGDENEKTRNELEEYTTRLENILGRKLADGHGTAKSIRLTLDPILLSYRSLAWYFCIGFVDLLTYLRLCRDGYHHHRQPLKRFFTLFPFRPVALTATQTSPVRHLTYWHRPHTSKTRLPVLFIHGIGIGLYPYVPFLDDLIKHVDDENPTTSEDDGQIGILAIEIMPVSFRLTHAALSKETMCNEINTILECHGWDSCVVVAHSYGTVIATHMLHNTHLVPKISSVLLIDPVCFLLHNPDVAYNFTVRKPTHANEWQLWYFGSQDPGVAHTLGRRFFWSQNVLWLEDLRAMMRELGLKFTVSLAGRDLIVDTEAVGRYLVGGGEDEVEQLCREKEWKEGGLKVLWNEDRDHAQVFDGRDGGAMRTRLVKVVRRYCDPTSSNGTVVGKC